MGKSCAEMGMLPASEGAVAPLFLALQKNLPTPAGNGWYYGSDAKRSPLHKYREPGTPEYDGSLPEYEPLTEPEAEVEAATEPEAAPEPEAEA
jgi:hypothetical protein